jgi:hypothetical protein
MTDNVIKKIDGKWYVKSEKGKNLGGPYNTEEEAKKRLKQVEYFKHNSFQNITFNLKPIIRHDQMEGRDYLVAPMIMMTEGVLNGSNGPLLYPSEELSKTPVVWNHKPVVVYHPDGTACDPAVISSRKIGVIMNTKFEEGKLKAEAWLEESRIKAVDDRILTAIEKNTIMELSTGLFTDNEEKEGEWNGKPYTAIARNYRPDHLAILPDLVGACSVEDGAGFLRLNSDKRLEEGWATLEYNSDNSGSHILISLKDGQRELVEQRPILSRLEMLINNELSFDDTRNLIYTALKDKNVDAWIADIFDDYFVYDKSGKFYKQIYIVKDSMVTLKGLPTQVSKKISYEIINERNVKMDKQKLVDSLISNKITLWEEKDRESLMAMNEDVLAKMIPIENRKSADEIAAEEEAKKKKEEEAKKNEETIKNEPPKPQTAKEYIEKAPKEIQAVLSNGLDTYNQVKTRLIGVITANKKNIFTKEQLESKDVNELRGIARLCAEDEKDITKNDYSGQGDPVIDPPITEEAYVMPVMNFSGKK